MSSVQGDFVSAGYNNDIEEKLNYLLASVVQNENFYKSEKNNIEFYSLNYHQYMKNEVFISNLPLNNPDINYFQHQLQQQKMHIKNSYNSIISNVTLFIDNLQQLIIFTKNVQSQIIDYELFEWHKQQRLSEVGVQMTKSLDSIEKWCQQIVDILWNTRSQIIMLLQITENIEIPLDMDTMGTQTSINFLRDSIQPYQQTVEDLIKSLVKASFVVEKQPPQIVKTQTKFKYSTKVRLLIGQKLNVTMQKPIVKVSILSEFELNNLITRDQYIKTAGPLLNNEGYLDYNLTTGTVTSTFENLVLKSVKRLSHNGHESVTEQKFYMIYESTFSIGHGSFIINVWTMSLPIIVTVNVSQNVQSWGTVFWHNSFSSLNKFPSLYHTPEEIPWSLLITTLSMKFHSTVGGILTEDNFTFLYNKLLKNTNYSYPDPNRVITWSQFWKETLPDGDFSFSDWFYEAMKLSAEHLREQWQNGYVIGFIEKEKAKDLLMTKMAGTFLLRFSNSLLGAVAIDWKFNDYEILSLQPFEATDLARRHLNCHINDVPDFKILYPTIPKELAFRNPTALPFSSSTPNPYVRRDLKTITMLDSCS